MRLDGHVSGGKRSKSTKIVDLIHIRLFHAVTNAKSPEAKARGARFLHLPSQGLGIGMVLINVRDIGMYMSTTGWRLNGTPL